MSDIELSAIILFVGTVCSGYSVLFFFGSIGVCFLDSVLPQTAEEAETHINNICVFAVFGLLSIVFGVLFYTEIIWLPWYTEDVDYLTLGLFITGTSMVLSSFLLYLGDYKRAEIREDAVEIRQRYFENCAGIPRDEVQQTLAKTTNKEDCSEKIVEIDGIKYRLTVDKINYKLTEV